MHIRLRHTTALALMIFGLSACGGTPEQKEARYIKRGEALFAEKKFEKARLEYRDALRIKPDDVNVIYHLGLVDDAEGNFRDAYAAFSDIEKQAPDFHPALLMLAEYYLAAGQYDQADQRIDAVLASSPDDAQAHAMRAARLFRQKQYDAAEQEARTARGDDPKNVLASSVLGGIYGAQNNMPKALAAIAAGIAQNPGNQTLLEIRADLYRRQKDLKNEAEADRALFEAAPDMIGYRIQLADDYQAAGQSDQAEAVLRDGVAALPDNWDMKHALVQFLGEHRGVAAAEKEIRASMQADPEKPDPIDWLVGLYLSHDMKDRAASFLDAIIAQNRYDKAWIAVMTARARIDYLNGDKDKAYERIAQVLAKDPNDQNAQFVKALTEASEGNDEQAIIDLRGIIRDKPSAKEAYAPLGEILLRQGHADLAIETLSQLVRLDPHDVPQQVRLAQLYALNGDPHHAMDILFIASKADPAYPGTWETTARIALDLKQWSTAAMAIDTLDGIKGQHATALLLRGDSLVLNGKFAEALSAYKQTIAMGAATPQAEQALPALLGVYKNQNRLADGAAYLETLPATPAIETLLGECYSVLKDDAKAAQAFNKAIADHSPRPTPYIELAQLYNRQHKTDAAVALLKQAAGMDRADLRAPLLEAEILERQGLYRPLLDLYTDLLARYPDKDIVANNYAEIVADHFSSDSGLLEKARLIAERFSASTDPLLLDTLGWVYFRQGRAQDALAILDRAHGLAPDRMPPQFHYHYGAAMFALGQYPQARDELKLAVAQGADYPGLDDARTLLAETQKK